MRALMWSRSARVLLVACLCSGLMGCTIERVEPGSDTAAENDGSRAVPTSGNESQQAAPSDTPNAQARPTLAFVTNGIASFWTIAEAGALKAARDLDVECLVRMPPEGVGDQKRMLEELIARRVDGVAVSPINPDNQAGILNEVAAKTLLITQDSDAPNTNRLAYIGMDNYTAGRLCGQLIKEAMPEGGEVCIFVGRLGQLNADLRRQGVIDELLDRPPDSTRRDPPSKLLKGEKYTILDTRTDNFDFTAAKALAEDAIAKYPNLGCIVGLFAYNPPYMLEALAGADRLGKIKVVGFDEQDETLQAIADGYCYGTVVQNPYRYGYESIRLLTDLVRKGKQALPPNGYIDIPARLIRRDNVEEFRAELQRLTQPGAAPPPEQASSAAPATTKASEARPGPAPALAPAQAAARAQPVKVAFVTNNPSDFWKIAEAGVRKAEADFNVQCEFQMPPNGTADDQQRIIEALMAKGISGMAISPNDAQNQIGILNRAAEQMHVICHDSDAPGSKRLAYIGTRNYKAGVAAGREIKTLLPDGGQIMIFVGRMDAQNAIERACGIRDELSGSNIEILDIRTDLTDRARAKQNVEDTISRYPNIGCLVGLWSYNGPAILEAVKDAGLASRVPIVCFDEEDATLQGVVDGHIQATVVQQPYQFGYQSVRVLAALARGEDPEIPDDKIVEIPVRVIKRDNVADFWAELKRLRGQ
jgi:ribose transport system substrate-binding protein